MKIGIDYIGVDFLIPDRDKVKKWIKEVVVMYGFSIGKLNYVFCDDEFLHSINVSHLEHDTYTDIITFDYSKKEIINGEIYISVDRIKENARVFNVMYERELLRVIIHGVLHLCGYKDKLEVEKSEMRIQEDRSVSLYYGE